MTKFDHERAELKIADAKIRRWKRADSKNRFKGMRGVGDLAKLEADISEDYRQIGQSSTVFLSNFIDCLERTFAEDRLESVLQYRSKLLDRYEEVKMLRILNHCLNGAAFSKGDNSWALEKGCWSWNSYPVWAFNSYARSAFHKAGGRKRRHKNFDAKLSKLLNS